MNTSVFLEQKHIDNLKRLATRLGTLQTRGPGKDVLPSISAAIRLLAELSDEPEFVNVVERLRNKIESIRG